MPGSRILLVAEGSGGHLLPAFQVATTLTRRRADVMMLCAQRPQTAWLSQDVTRQARRAGIQMASVPLPRTAGWSAWLRRTWQCGRLWQMTHDLLDHFQPDVVVGFGGWFSVPILLAARRRRVKVILHEQNVTLGRANRWLTSRVDRLALSFEQTRASLNGTSSVVTGLPIRSTIATPSRVEASRRFGLKADRPTVLILGGSQGAHPVNDLVCQMLEDLREPECQWQFVHLTGARDAEGVRRVYTKQGLSHWTAPYLVEMPLAYAQADLVICRAGASTIAELAACGKPAILIPYPHASAHQQANAAMVEAIGGGVLLEEADVTPSRLLAVTRQILTDGRLRRIMGEQMRRLAMPDAANRLAETILALSGSPAPWTLPPC